MPITMEGRVEDIELRAHYSPDGTRARVEVLKAPPLSAISLGLLDELGPGWLDPDTETPVLVLAPGIRYLIGQYQPRTRTLLLHRLP